MGSRFKFQWYQEIYENFPRIRNDARKAAQEFGLDTLNDGSFGLYPGSSSCPGLLPNYVLDAIVKANKEVIPMRKVQDELRNLIKDIFGDDYDSAVTNTCEAAIRVTLETLMAPPILRIGDTYRCRFLTLYGEDTEYTAGYGRPFPPQYKNLFVDKSVTGGELAVEAKCLPNLDSLLVKPVGTKYEVHGIKYNVVPLMTETNAEKSIEKIKTIAEKHITSLTGFVTLGYDTPGYGYGEKDQNGVPLLKKGIGRLSQEFEVPYALDGGGGVPVIGLGPNDVNGDIMMWSMDKAARAPICGLIVGKEEVMVPVRKGLGVGGQKYGEVSSHGKARYSMMDPGRDAVVGLIAVLKMLHENSEKITKPIDQYHEILVEAFKSFEPNRFRDKLIFTKSYTMGGTELNYEQTWEEGKFGIPIFNMEDMFANTNPIIVALDEMGVGLGATIYSGNMFLTPGLGTLDEEGNLITERATLAAQALVRAVEITCKYAGLTD
ncbi:MAG: hypothetical protein JSW11_05670 [Candidatus Heimdallarchaeota archaeon]|nr:MAG: hypothetical protein JSW11_05670 [Candidatus Heimdallarchaeota archaeon]